MTPEDEERVRQVLAGTPAESGMPAEVAARLDATLARLVAEREPTGAAAASGGSGLPDELEERRRRRWPKVLVAAASVVLVGYGVGTVVDGMAGSSGGSASSAFSEAGSAGQADSQSDGVTRNGLEGAPQPAKVPADARLLGYLREGRPVPLRRQTLHQDVATLLTDRAALDESRRNVVKDRYGVAGAGCELPDTGRRDEVVAARLDGHRSTLVLRKAVDGSRVAEVYSCGDPSRLLAITRVDVPRQRR